MPLLGAYLAAQFLLYLGLFFGLAKALDLGTPLDALKGAFHRSWLGAAATLGVLVVYMFCRLASVEPQLSRLMGVVALWVLRVPLWILVVIRVYRVTRWRKPKLAVFVGLGLALNLGMDLAADRILGAGSPAFGDWIFRLV